MATKKNTEATCTITQAAEKLGITRQAVHEAIKKRLLEAERGKIVQTRVVKSTVVGWKITEKSLEEYRVSGVHQSTGKKTR
jgi:predicted transcriptional regulator